MKAEARVTASSLVDSPAQLAFRLTFADTGKPDTEAKDVVILMAGPMRLREIAAHRGDGIYSVDFKVPTPGTYVVFLSSQSRGLAYLPYATVTVMSRPN